MGNLKSISWYRGTIFLHEEETTQIFDDDIWKEEFEAHKANRAVVFDCDNHELYVVGYINGKVVDVISLDGFTLVTHDNNMGIIDHERRENE